MKEIIKPRYCAFPNCKSLCASKGKRENGFGLARHKWCRFHRKGKGKMKRVEYSKSI
jgi:hypothetical protein